MKLKKKQLLSLILSVAMIMTAITTGITANAAQSSSSGGTLPFKDVPANSWYHNSVQYVYDAELMKGTSATEFTPEGSLDRAMFVTILGRMAKVDQSKYPDSSFKDVKTGQWYSAYIEWAYKKGITQGTGGGKFGYDDPVSREQMATFIARYVGMEGLELPDDPNPVAGFKDESKVSSWAKDGLELMRKSGIIKGDDKGNFNPQAYATRAQAAAIFERLNGAVENITTEYTVKFESNGGESVAAQKIVNGKPAVKPTDPKREGYAFAGWYSDKGLTKAYDFSTAVKADITLYAKWKVNTFVNVKDVVTFGHYPQTASGTDNTPIEWIVLDKKDGKALLLSKYALDCQKYNSSYTDITWADCTLRTWLNSTFINKAFTADEQSSILTTNVSNPDSYWGYDKTTGDWDGNNSGTETFNPNYGTYHVAGGENTQDKVFLLSLDEAKSLLGYERQTLTYKGGGTYNGYPNMQAACTDYAYSQGAWRSSSYITPAGEACCWWWLRSPGDLSYYAAYVNYAGYVDNCDVDNDDSAVRPALWVNLAS